MNIKYPCLTTSGPGQKNVINAPPTEKFHKNKYTEIISTAISSLSSTCKSMLPPSKPKINSPLKPMYAQITLASRYLNNRNSANVAAVMNAMNTAAFAIAPSSFTDAESLAFSAYTAVVMPPVPALSTPGVCKIFTSATHSAMAIVTGYTTGMMTSATASNSSRVTT